MLARSEIDACHDQREQFRRAGRQQRQVPPASSARPPARRSARPRRAGERSRSATAPDARRRASDRSRRAAPTMIHNVVLTACSPPPSRRRHDHGEQHAGRGADRDMPGRSDHLVGDHRGRRACRHHRQPQRPLAEIHHQAEEIDRQQEIDAEAHADRESACRRSRRSSFHDPAHIDRQRHAHVPGEADRLAALAPCARFRRIAGRPGRKMPIAFCSDGQCRMRRPIAAGIEHMAEIDREDRTATISHGAMFWPNSSMPTIWLAPPIDRRRSSAPPPTRENPLSTASAPNSRPNGADATITGMPERTPCQNSPDRDRFGVASADMSVPVLPA